MRHSRFLFHISTCRAIDPSFRQGVANQNPSTHFLSPTEEPTRTETPFQSNSLKLPKNSKLNFNQFKASFSSNVQNLKRRFSSGDLSSENEDGGEAGSQVPPGQVPQSPQQNQNQAGQAQQRQQAQGQAQPNPPRPNQNARTISAPTSPTRSTSIMQRVQSLTGAAKDAGRELISNAVAGAANIGGGTVGGVKLPLKKEGVYYLLVVDDSDTDWSKYFRSRTTTNNNQIEVHQAEFRHLSIVSSSDFGSVVNYTSPQTRTVVSFMPDFVLFRQNLRDAGADYKKLLISLGYGRVGSVNSLQAVYNFQDKPWVFGALVGIMKKIGRDNFPLISQNFYPDWVGMGEIQPGLPAVLKIGHAHGGLGKIRAGTVNEWKDASSVVAVTGTYCTSEPYVEARCDVHIQKIGNQYKAFMRKGIAGHWKSAQGSGILEQVSMNDRYRNWVDAVATLFGGLDICEVEVVVSRTDSREYIIEVNDSAMSLLGESQEEDRRTIAELVIARMENIRVQKIRRDSEERERRESKSNASSAAGAGSTEGRRDSQGGTRTFFRQNSNVGASEESEDTMKNLRKTFAGIFGEM